MQQRLVCISEERNALSSEQRGPRGKSHRGAGPSVAGARTRRVVVVVVVVVSDKALWQRLALTLCDCRPDGARSRGEQL
jgi:hypothetical protein